MPQIPPPIPLPERHVLSKSTFVKGRQCVKALFLHRHRPDLRQETPPERQAVYDRGHQVGRLAQQLFPGGIDVSPEDQYGFVQSAERTQELIRNGQEVIYEATFLHEGVLVMVDILARLNGQWEAFEVKSTSSLKETHVVDAALQYHVITGTGLPLRDISIVHLNKQYVRMGELDLSQLFLKVSVLDAVVEMQENVREDIDRFKHILAQEQTPVVEIGAHCDDPYSCDFKHHCWAHVPQLSVFNIAGLRMERKVELYQNGIIRFEDITDEVELSDHHRLQVRCHLNNTEYIDRPELDSFLRTAQYPLYFLDFESFNPPIPLYDGSRPFQQIPFQFSLHYKASPEGELRHTEFLAETLGDPRPAFIKELITKTEKPGKIVVFNQTFELDVLKKLALYDPQFTLAIQDRMERIRDLSIPFRKRHCYRPSMKGAYSLKTVLPAMVSGMSYEGMVIGDGSEASNAFASMVEQQDKDHSKLRAHLLEYCKMDTLAMVRILEQL